MKPLADAIGASVFFGLVVVMLGCVPLPTRRLSACGLSASYLAIMKLLACSAPASRIALYSGGSVASDFCLTMACRPGPPSHQPG